MNDTELGEAKRRLLEALNRMGTATAGELGSTLRMTSAAAHQHLARLRAAGLVVAEPRPAQGRGRPALLWRLAPAARAVFPDRHGELTVSLIQHLRASLGDDALRRVIDARRREQQANYQRQLPPPSAPLRAKVDALARARSAEGYMAEVETPRRGHYRLIEHHCSICEAAQACPELCQAELDLFRRCLGPQVVVERTRHMPAGDDRCVYEIGPIHRKNGR